MTAIIGAGTLTTGLNAIEADIPEDIPDIPERGDALNVSVETIIMSALIFIGILVWFEFLRVWFDIVFTIEAPLNFALLWNRLWYAIFITALVLVFIYIVYYIFRTISPCKRKRRYSH